MRSINYRKFICKQFNDVVAWDIEPFASYKNGKTTTSAAMDLSISEGRNQYALHLYKDTGESVAKALEPLNELIAALSKAGIEFAKACNTLDAKKDVPTPTKNSKKNESKAKANPTKG